MQQWNSGPQMANARAYHGCGSFYFDNKLVLIVAGNWAEDANGNSVEFLVPSDDEPEWIPGKTSLVNSCIHAMSISYFQDLICQKWNIGISAIKLSQISILFTM